MDTVLQSSQPSIPFRVGIVLYDNLLGTSATLPVEMLKTAEAAAAARNKQARRIQTSLISIDNSPVISPSGFSFYPDHTIQEDTAFDLVNLPALWRNPRPALRKYTQYIPWLTSVANQGAWITAVGTGACFLAETGLLEHRPATTHWHYFDQFQRDYPAVELKRQYFTTQAGNLYCAASVNAMAELMVHLCHRLYGQAVASIVERNFFHEIRNSFQPDSFFSERTTRHPDEEILQAQIWLEDNFSQPVKIESLAKQFGFSQRNFDRRFHNALGMSPMKFLQSVRLKNACDLLAKSNLSVSDTASLCGYQSAATFSHLFRKTFHTTPTEYRKTVRSKLFGKNFPVEISAE